MNPVTEWFELRGVVHLVRPTGTQARDLEQLRAGLVEMPARAVFFHTRHCRLRHAVGDEPPPDDFTNWVSGVVQDRETAERLSFAVQTPSDSVEAQRASLVAALDRVPPQTRTARDAPAEGALVFLTSESVTLPTGSAAASGAELVEALASADVSVCFYHLLEEPWFTEGQDVFAWLEDRGEDHLAEWLRELASSGLPIEAMRRKLAGRARRGVLRRRLGEVAGTPEDVRREAGRAAVAGLVRRLGRPGEPE